MADIDQLAQNFKSLKELRQYCNSQYQVITALNKKIAALEEESKHLKDMLTKTVPIVNVENGSLEVYQSMTDELAVCVMQIKLLKDKCRGGAEELTFEDAKKLDIYTKLLVQLRSGKKSDKNNGESLTDEELLKLLKDEVSEKNG